MDVESVESTEQELLNAVQIEKRKVRKEIRRINMLMARQSETPEERLRRLELQRLRAARARHMETDEQREKRLKANRERIAKIRQNETPEQKQSRLQKQRERIKEMRKIASDEQRKKYRQEVKDKKEQYRDQMSVYFQSRIQELSIPKKPKGRRPIKVILESDSKSTKGHMRKKTEENPGDTLNLLNDENSDTATTSDIDDALLNVENDNSSLSDLDGSNSLDNSHKIALIIDSVE